MTRPPPGSGSGPVAAGVADAGLASLASFAVGLYAIRALEPGALAGYALVFTAFNLLALIPAQLVYVPAETAAAGAAEAHSAAGARSLLLGLPAAALAALLLPLWWAMAPAGIPAAPALALTATAALCTLLSPVQDHLRRMLHVAGRSRSAAGVSALHLAVALAGIAAGPRLASAGWIPFGALAAANAVSLGAGLLLLRWAPVAAAPPLGELLRTGGPLLAAAALGPASAFVAANLVGHLAGATAVGLAEATRIVGQPVLVLATGLSAVLGPRSVRAARRRSPAEAQRVARLFQRVTLAGGAAYLLLAGPAWLLNPLPRLVPAAYVVPGLAAAAVLAAIANGALYPGRSELLGLERSGDVMRVDAAGAGLRIAVAWTAGLVGPFAVPLGFLALGSVRWAGYRWVLRGAYRADRPGARRPGQRLVPRSLEKAR